MIAVMCRLLPTGKGTRDVPRSIMDQNAVPRESDYYNSDTNSRRGSEQRGQDLQGSTHPLFTLCCYRQRLLALGVTMLLIWGGYSVRVWVFRHTVPIRFFFDLDSAWSRGNAALAHGAGRGFAGIVGLYSPLNLQRIDYPPLRLYLVTAWVWYIKHRHGPTVDRSDDVMYPMLAVNFFFELLAVSGLYSLCRLFRGHLLSLVAACCLLFNPAVIFNSFGWIQWDVWVVPPVIWATWAILRPGHLPDKVMPDFFAGVCLGLGAMLKGQILFVAWWFPFIVIGLSLLDPRPFGQIPRSRLSRGRLGLQQAAARLMLLVSGFTVAVCIVTLPFTLCGSADWTSVYRQEMSKVQPMSLHAWNLPAILVSRYGWASESVPEVGFFGWSMALPVMQWLKYLFVGWVVLIALQSIRARQHSRVLLVTGAIFAVVFAVLPGMHERYGMWAAAFLSVSVCVCPAAAFLYVIVTGLALACPLSVCLNFDPSFAPDLKRFLDTSADSLSLLWLVCTVALTVLVGYIPPLAGCPRSDSRISALEPCSGSAPVPEAPL
jgi:hypothetical protein